MTYSEEYIKLIKDWIRPLQKSLTIETESNFTNILGRQTHFNDYLYESHLIKGDTHTISPNTIDLFQKFIKKNI